MPTFLPTRYTNCRGEDTTRQHAESFWEQMAENWFYDGSVPQMYVYEPPVCCRCVNLRNFLKFCEILWMFGELYQTENSHWGGKAGQGKVDNNWHH